MHSPSVITAVIFDLDGTLVDSRRAVVDAVARGVDTVLQRHGIVNHAADRAAIMEAMGLPSEQYYRQILPPSLSSLGPEVKEAATQEEVNSLAAGQGRLYPKVLETLQKLRRRDVALAIVSNAQEPYFTAALKYLDLEALIDHRECHEELPPQAGEGKAVLLTRALRALRRSPPQALMVGDRGEDIEAGHAVGTSTAAVNWGFAGPGELSEADFLLTEFSQLLTLVAAAGDWHL